MPATSTDPVSKPLFIRVHNNSTTYETTAPAEATNIQVDHLVEAFVQSMWAPESMGFGVSWDWAWTKEDLKTRPVEPYMSLREPLDCVKAVADAYVAFYHRHQTCPTFIFHPHFRALLDASGQMHIDEEVDSVVRSAGVVGRLWCCPVLETSQLPENPGWKLI